MAAMMPPAACAAQKSIHRMRHSADAHRVDGRYEQAETLYVNALKLAEATLGPDHSEVSDRRDPSHRLRESDIRAQDKLRHFRDQAGRAFQRSTRN